MLIEEFKNIKCEKDQLRRFGISLGIVLCLLGGVFFLRGRNYYYFFIASAIFLLSGVVLPILLRPIYKILTRLTILIGWVLTNVILIVLFYFVITPIGLIAKLFGKDFLESKCDKNTDTYWIPKKQVKFKQSNYERQF